MFEFVGPNSTEKTDIMSFFVLFFFSIALHGKLTAEASEQCFENKTYK